MTNGQMCIQPTGLPLVWSEAAARNTQCADHDTAAAPKQTSCRTVGSCTHGGGVDSRWDCRPGCGGDAGSGRHRRGCGRCLCGRGWGTVVQGHDAVADVEVGEVLPCNYAPAGVTFLRRFRLPPLKHPTQPPREVNANYSLHATHVLLLQIESERANKKKKKKRKKKERRMQRYQDMSHLKTGLSSGVAVCSDCCACDGGQLGARGVCVTVLLGVGASTALAAVTAPSKAY